MNGEDKTQQTTDQAFRRTLRAAVRGVYDLQKIRIEMGNRLCAEFRVRLGQAPGTAEDEMNEHAQRLLMALRRQYRLMAVAFIGMIDREALSPELQELIDSKTMVMLATHYLRLERAEAQQFKELREVLSESPIYPWLDSIAGIGPAMAGVLLAELDIHRARYPSSFWRYAGLDVGEDGRGRSRRAEHLVDVTYTDKNGEEQTKKSITFNPFLKTKLVGVLAASFLKQGARCPYRAVYDGYKHRLESHPAHAEKTPGQRHNMAMRYMIKIFLIDLHREWCLAIGREPSVPYQEAKLGHRHTA